MAWSPQSNIYGLRFDGGDVFYVGKARNPSARIKSHISQAKHPATPLYEHVADGLAAGKDLEMVILEVCNLETESEREAFWIWKLSDQLFNRMVPGWSVMTAEEAAEMRDLDEQVARCRARMAELVARGRSRKVRAEQGFKVRSNSGAVMRRAAK